MMILLLFLMIVGCASPPPQAMCDALVQRVEKAQTIEDATWATKQYDHYRCAR